MPGSLLTDGSALVGGGHPMSRAISSLTTTSACCVGRATHGRRHAKTSW